ncbi:AKR_collapsed_G0010080.mRNA.1.CDS.1 [Saccharomyces cerevisiae]|nr:ALH_1c_G0009800.mRNA.1.CDS.1 [Saccharomyces cerevisiae]CAI5247033.1 AKR_HP2_G0009960.mRNA.1.CDS.1 [Saccharomyces cerevisiae]CAI6427286.1 AKR_HP2_G0009960.mRNA.1.CDS.1 [Saccharomyces cerevisiae]CAI6428775.1 AKR_HP1_G0009460.mRNA.1.CDS.1 [Saccharomyces cerevisiae]CAI6556198.1 ALH_1c_G0009800.mRNA.1.CDS.1 [Saccharomyces cerevisiae]
MAPATPKTSKTAHFKNGSTSSQKKMKQSSLLSFFSKQVPSGTPSKKVQKPTPATLENTATDKITKNPQGGKTGKLFVDADEDNDLTIAEETVSTVRSDIMHSQEPQSDTMLNSNTTEPKSTTTDEDLSSSQSRRNHKRRVNYAESDDDDSDTTFTAKRKKGKVVDSESDEDEYLPDKNDGDEDDDIADDKEDIKGELAEDSGDDDDLISLAETTSKKKFQTTLRILHRPLQEIYPVITQKRKAGQIRHQVDHTLLLIVNHQRLLSLANSINKMKNDING